MKEKKTGIWEKPSHIWFYCDPNFLFIYEFIQISGTVGNEGTEEQKGNVRDRWIVFYCDEEPRFHYCLRKCRNLLNREIILYSIY